MKKNKCDECGTELEKTWIFDMFLKIPITCWVCPKSEFYQLYQKEYEEYKDRGLKND